MENNNANIIMNALDKYGIQYNENTIKQFTTFYDKLIEVNSYMNLTAITDWSEVQLKHFSDSVSLIGYLNDKIDRLSPTSDIAKNASGSHISYNDFTKSKILDLGTGAGFPGLPLKIVCPETDITLADSLNKRIGFLNSVIDELGLNKINAIHGRAEEMARQKNMRESYDIVVSRAVANASTLSEYCLPFVKVGGYFISYKTESVDEEALAAEKAIKVLGGEINDIFHFTLPDSDIHRSFLIIKKIKNTPKAYPRKPGTPSKDPL